jgi:hypothetical protein
MQSPMRSDLVVGDARRRDERTVRNCSRRIHLTTSQSRCSSVAIPATNWGRERFAGLRHGGAREGFGHVLTKRTTSGPVPIQRRIHCEGVAWSPRQVILRCSTSPLVPAGRPQLENVPSRPGCPHDICASGGARRESHNSGQRLGVDHLLFSTALGFLGLSRTWRGGGRHRRVPPSRRSRTLG